MVHQAHCASTVAKSHELLPQHYDPKVAALTGISATKQQTNLANDPQYAAKLAEMRALLLAEMRRLHDPWRFSGQPDDGLAAPESKPKPRKKKE